jgi:hypothetical protein
LGSESCVPCHQKEKIQLKSRHARTLARVNHKDLAPLFEDHVRKFDPAMGLVFSTQVKNGRCLMIARSQTEQVEAEPEWAFGSGDIGVTFVGQTDAGPTELRLTHYGRSSKWDFTPAQRAGWKVDHTLGRPLTREKETECFRCHSTALVQEKGRVAPEKSILGVGCESCHGPGKAHVKAVSQGAKDLKMRRLGEVREHVSLGLCGQCHRSLASVDLDDPVTASQLPRLQGVALSLSGCFKKGKVTCVSCHDVHQNADETPRLVYNQRCMSCHTPGRTDQKSCPPRPTGECVSCHMPTQGVEMPTDPKFRTHWIKVWPNMVEGQN